jgi:hypothetical protein
MPTLELRDTHCTRTDASLRLKLLLLLRVSAELMFRRRCGELPYELK